MFLINSSDIPTRFRLPPDSRWDIICDTSESMPGSPPGADKLYAKHQVIDDPLPGNNNGRLITADKIKSPWPPTSEPWTLNTRVPESGLYHEGGHLVVQGSLPGCSGFSAWITCRFGIFSQLIGNVFNRGGILSYFIGHMGLFFCRGSNLRRHVADQRH